MRAIVNGNKSFELSSDKINESVLWLEGEKVILRSAGKNIHALIISVDHSKKEYQIEIDKKIYQVKLESDLEARIHNLPMKTKSSTQVNSIKSPMPGLVLKINKTPGEEVSAGETLLVLEAMKMENLIKSPINGTIQSIPVIIGAAVDKGTTLIIFEQN